MKRILYLLLVSFTCICFFSSEIKAAGMGGGGNPCGGPFPPCPIPLDSGEILLLIAGATLGAYKIYHSFKKKPA